jgi:imidazole glycerol-phosphate synthase subunit HisF
VLPVVLLTGYNVVKSVRFSSFRTLGNPITVCRIYDARGVDELVLLDIRATPENRQPNLEIISDITSECFMPLTVGGGVKTLKHARDLLRYGADKVTINTAAVENPDLITELSRELGAQCVVVSIDAKRQPDGSYFAVTNSGTKVTGLRVEECAKEAARLGAGEILLNSIDQDGTMEGFDIDLIKLVTSKVQIPVVACGGAGKPEHFAPVVLEGDADAVAAASIYHFTRTTPNDVKAVLRSHGIPVRIS